MMWLRCSRLTRRDPAVWRKQRRHNRAISPNSIAILKTCRAAIPDSGKLVIIDGLIPAGNEPHPAKLLDLHMMVSLGGRERSADDFRAVFASAGFELTKVVPLPGPVAVVEAVPA